MLPARSRMRRRRDFEAAFRAGRRAGRRLLGARLAVPDGGERPVPPLVGFAVSRRVGNAPTRNRVRRRLRHLVRDRLDALPPGSLLVVSANPVAAAASYAELSDELDALLRRLSRPEEGRAR